MAYRQYCALARSLDLVGDRWTLLIVRELLAGATRYGEIRAGLPGVPSNLLADRLRRLEGDGLLVKVDQQYRLTDRGEALRSAVHELIRWGEPLMLQGRGDDRFRGRWLIPALDALLAPGDPARIELHVEGDAIHVVTDPRRVIVGAGPVAGADATLTGSAEAMLAVAAGHLDLRDAAAQALIACDGDLDVARAAFRTTSQADAS